MTKNLKIFTKPIHDLKKFNKAIFVLIVSSGLTTILPLSIPLILQKIIDEGIIKKNYEKLIEQAILLFFVAILTSLMNYVVNMISKKINNRYISEMRKKLLVYLKNGEWWIIKSLNSGEILNIYMSDVTNIASFYTGNIYLVLNDIVTAMFAIYMLIKIDFQMFLVITVIQSITFLLSQRINKIVNNKVEEFNIKNDLLNLKVQDFLSKIEYLIKSNFYNYKENEIHDLNSQLLKTEYQLENIENLNLSFTNLFRSIIIAIIYLLGGIRIINGYMTFGQLTMFSLFSTRYISPLLRLIDLRILVARTKKSIERVYYYLEANITENKVSTIIDNLNGDIIFENVKFSYDNKTNIFGGLNCIIKTNKINLIRGKSGIGKSTLSSLILGYLMPDEGEIFISNIKLSNICKESLRNNIAYVSQDIDIFNSTIRENITMGMNLSDFEIYEALNEVRLKDFIVSLEHRLDTTVSKSNISGGQAQRIALCRAYVADRNIIILDEVTANIDDQNQNIIIESIRQVFKGKTVIIISHNEAFFKIAENIIELK